MSGFSREDRLKPVITVVINFSTKKWDGPRRLSEMMQIPNEQVRKLVRDYEMLIIDPHSMDEEEFEKFSTDFGLTMRFLKHASREGEIEKLLQEKKEYKISRKAADVLNACAHLHLQYDDREGAINMCKAWDDHYESGRKVGILEGRAEGKAEGRAEGKAEAMKELAWTMYQKSYGISEISKLLNQPEETIREWTS